MRTRLIFLLIAWLLWPASLRAAPHAVAAGSPGDDGYWSSLNWPGPRYGHTAVSDPEHDRVLVFGGHNGAAYLNDFWVLTLADPPRWMFLRPLGNAPVPRYTHSAIYDPVGDRMIVFGGFNGHLQNDLWELSLSGVPAWSPLAAAGAPPAARHRHSAIYDPPRQRMIVFGGTTDSTLLDDVWSLSLSGGAAWTRIFPAGSGPSPRYRHTAIYDPVRDRMIVFGGRGDSSTYDDAWALSLNGAPAWSQITPSGSLPSTRNSHVAVYDPGGDRMVIYGGNGVTRNDAWSLALSGTPAWTRLDPAGSPPAAHKSHAAILDGRRERLVVFGGEPDSGAATQELSLLALASGPAWSQVLQTPGPPMGGGHTTVYDPAHARLIAFGGETPQGRTNEAWALSLDPSPYWSRIHASGTPPEPRWEHCAIYDPLRERMMVYGGRYLTSFDDLWTLSLSDSTPAWENPQPTFPPPNRSEAFYDPIRDRMDVYSSEYNDFKAQTPPVYALFLSPEMSPWWIPRVSRGYGPASSWEASVIYDPVRDRMIAFGGQYVADYYSTNEVWALSLQEQTWSPLTPAGEPPPGRFAHVAAYDPIRDRMIVLGGRSSFQRFNDTWELSLSDPPTWRQLSLRYPLIPDLVSTTVVFVPSRDWLIVQGGFIGSREDNGVWILEGSQPTDPACQCPGTRARGAGGAVSLQFEISHPLPGERSLSWALRSARDWPGFPMHGTAVVGTAGQPVALEVAVPDTASPGSNRLKFSVWFTESAGDLITCESEITIDPLLDAPPAAPRPPRLALLGIRPNPSDGDVSVAFSLPARGRGTLELFDVSGRRVAHRELELDAGDHVVLLARGAQLAPGVFIVRLRFAGRTLTARAVHVR